MTNENVESLVKKSLRISTWWQKITNPAWGPSEQGAPCDCAGHTPMKSALPTALSPAGFHCLNCFLSACPASGACGQTEWACWQRHTGLGHQQVLARASHMLWGVMGSLWLWVARKSLSLGFWKFPLGRVGRIPQVVLSFWTGMQGERCVSHCVSLEFF